MQSVQGSQGQSSRSLESGVSNASSEGSSRSRVLQKEAMEYDRRQIRRKLADTLRDRGIDPEEDDDEENVEDDDSVYDDTEIFPWKQREAAVQAAAAGGKTEGRMEGFDSLERALQAHQHQIHYGRGKGFGWSSQHKASSSNLLQTQNKLKSMRQLTDWTSFRDLSQNPDDGGDIEEDFQDELDGLVESDKKAAKKTHRHNSLLSTLYLLIAIGATLGFAYYIETIKIDTYQTYLPKGYTANGEADPTVEQGASDSQAPFAAAAIQTGNVA
mmetsp:Transcript_15440/g.25710  ORF Transcript_15440/g.25710 Transcript_15440/m.25710 type:complete len:271 (-) Transcript_15440:783-1595(-)